MLSMHHAEMHRVTCTERRCSSLHSAIMDPVPEQRDETQSSWTRKTFKSWWGGKSHFAFQTRSRNQSQTSPLVVTQQASAGTHGNTELQTYHNVPFQFLLSLPLFSLHSVKPQHKLETHALGLLANVQRGCLASFRPLLKVWETHPGRPASTLPWCDTETGQGGPMV